MIQVFENLSINLFLFSIINVILIFFYSKLAHKFGLLDYPDYRKRHSGIIPLVGGLVIYTSLLIFYFQISTNYWIDIICVSSTIIFVVGLIDDKKQIGIIVRLLAQIFACLLVMGVGLTIVDIGSYFDYSPLEVGIYGLLFTILCVVGLTNAINFMDGIDGLASGIILHALVSILLFSYLDNGIQNSQILLYLIFSLIIFLVANLSPVLPKIFLGDSGSMLIGFLVAWLLIYYSHPNVRAFHPVLTIWCVSIPTFDLLSVFTKRIIKKTNPFTPDRGHIHHLFINYGINANVALTYIISLSIFFSLVGIISYKILGSFYSLLIFWFCFILYLCISLLMDNKSKLE